ncbi:DUF4365 domain-containing protein [Streptomyces sp. NBC_01477]|uniref:DUF4365 domain-containing protein n=1 Tax=Streptomyces sp. NBC_01477 TaxID=2976015 RepID=UPI002E2EB555|nr:DUF4365 domain-containing protein [Streptomyces sp. NBC_01477]
MGDPETWQQEQISLAYVSAVATHAGCTIAAWNVDKDGVDVTLKRNHITVDLQMKCTHAATLLSDGQTYSFSLDAPTYNKLRDPYRSSAGFLGLVVVERDLDDWLVHSQQDLLMRCSGYWARVQDLPNPGNVDSKTLHLPKSQRIDSLGIDEMFDYAFKRLFPNAPEGDFK